MVTLHQLRHNGVTEQLRAGFKAVVEKLERGDGVRRNKGLLKQLTEKQKSLFYKNINIQINTEKTKIDVDLFAKWHIIN